MIRVEAQLISAIDPDRDANLCTVEIGNDGTGSRSRANYDVRLYARNDGRLIRTARVENYPRNALPAWRLIAAAMAELARAPDG